MSIRAKRSGVSLVFLFSGVPMAPKKKSAAQTKPQPKKQTREPQTITFTRKLTMHPSDVSSENTGWNSKKEEKDRDDCVLVFSLFFLLLSVSVKRPNTIRMLIRQEKTEDSAKDVVAPPENAEKVRNQKELSTLVWL